MLTIDDVLGQRTLTRSVRTLDTSSTDRKFQDLFDEGRETLKPRGTKAEYLEIQSSRGLAPVTGIDSPMPIKKTTSLVDRETEMFRIAEKRFIPQSRLYLNADPEDPELNPNAPGVIRSELKDMLLEIGKTKEYIFSRSLTAAGATVSKANIPNSDLEFPLTFGVKAATALADWSAAGTAIITSEMPAFQAAMVNNCGKAIARAIINDKVFPWVAGNTEFQKFAINWDLALKVMQASALGERFADGIRVAGVDWTVNGFGYKNSGDANVTRWMIDEHAIFLPDDLEDVLQVAEGLQAIPVQAINILSDGEPGEVSELRRGLVSYALHSQEPVGVWVHAAWFGSPLVIQPDAVLDGNLNAP